jgi:TolB-like protein/class 3 adenylate cyclase
VAESTERRLAAIMFTDLVGSTALMARSEELALAVKQRHRSLVRPLVERYHGRWIESPGDETLSTFPNSLDAVNCALAIQEGRSGDEDLRIHVGMHAGDVIDRDGEIHGDGVNIAARVCSLSEGGGICITGEVHQSVRNQANVRSTALEERDLKNVGRAVVVFSVEGEALPPSARGARSITVVALLAAAILAVGFGGWWLGRPSLDVPEIRSIAVLPLENLGNPEQEYVADGVTDALIESLARVGSELRVISRTSVMQYRGTTKSSPEIADELGVEFLIEGTAQRQGDRVLIRVQLIDASADAHVWAQSYERDLRDFFSLQREIARAVAGEVHVALAPEREPLLAETRRVDPEALDLYLRARAQVGLISTVSIWGPPALELLEQSVALDPDFADGWVSLAGVSFILASAGLGESSRENLVRAGEAVQRALDLDERLGAAHGWLGIIRLYTRDFSGARIALERAVELSPSDSIALGGLARYLVVIGRGKSPESELLHERLLQVAPLDLSSRDQRIWNLLYSRQYERGIAEVERIREFAPEYANQVVGWLNIFLGRHEDARRELLAFYSTRYGGTAFASWGDAFQRGSEEGGWRGGMRALTRLRIQLVTQGAFGLSYLTAQNLAVLGETEQAMTLLERAYDERDTLLVLANVDPALDSLRSDPRFQDLLRRIGFPES